jgi:hypothetical protein
MKWLRIQTEGEAQIESFTVLGASSARGQADKIGQFGSGAKHAILCALRAGLAIAIYCGKTKIVPQSSPQTINGVLQERVSFKIGTRTESSSMVLDFGSLDWTKPIEMMLREFISNALDAVGGQWSKIGIDFVDDTRAKAGYTTIYVQLTQGVREYVSRLQDRFLHVNNEQSKKLLQQNPGSCKFYRKGVFVKEIERANALYSYNCGDELPIDESRNLDSDRVRNFATVLLCDDEIALRNVVRQCVELTDKFYEREFSYWRLDSRAVAQAMRSLYGDDVCVTDSSVTFNRCQTKGLNVKLMSDCGGYFNAATGGGVPDAIKMLSKADAQGLSTFAASELLLSNVCFVWDKLQSLNLCGTVELPAVFEFERPTMAGEDLGGFYSQGEHAIFIHREHVGRLATIIEELAHAITKSNDETRDFQDYAFRLAGLLMEQGRC